MTLDLYRGESLAPSREWVALAPEERRRRTMAAVAAQDVTTLLDLLEAHHVRTHGQVSRETLRKYRLGGCTWLDYAGWHAVHPDPGPQQQA